MLTLQGRMPPFPRIIILIGLPGSGKSWFAKHLTEKAWIHINQDILGSRSKVENTIRSESLKGSKIIIDRCNVTSNDRTSFISLLNRPPDIIAIYFEVDSKTCIARCEERFDHPTLKPTIIRKSNNKKGGNINAAISNFSKQLEVPEMSEGFCCIWTIRTFDDSKTLLMKFGHF